MRKDKPILFSGTMVRAILREIECPGTGKTQTRRILKCGMPEPPSIDNVVHHPARHERPYLDAYNKTSWWCWWTRDDRPCEQFDAKYAVGDLLWVRETWCHTGTGVWKPSDVHMAGDGKIIYRADNDDRSAGWFPSIFMVRSASRLTLEVTDVRVERLQDISEADALAEGVTKVREHCYVIRGFDYDTAGLCHSSATTPYAKLWDYINGADAWETNPFVVAISFRPHLINIDAFLKQREAA